MKKAFKHRRSILPLAFVAAWAAGAAGFAYKSRVIEPLFSNESEVSINRIRQSGKIDREAVASLGPLPQHGSPFEISRNVIAGGGGSSTDSGNLLLQGTIGQAAAGPTLGGGGFFLTGGFAQPESGATPA